MREQTVTIDMPPEFRWDSEIQKTVHESLPYQVPNFISATFEGRSISVKYRGPVAPHSVEIEVAHLVYKIARGFRDVTETYLSGSEGAARLQDGDPFITLVENREVVSTGRGKFVYAKDFLRAFDGLDRLLEDYCVSRGAKRERYPSTVETKSLIDSGYLTLHPHLAYFVSPGKLSRDALAELGKISILDPENRESAVANLGSPDQILAPTVCYHCFEAHKGQLTPAGLMTAINQCHRHELVNVKSLERLTTYWMRELVAFGDPEAIVGELDSALEFTTGLLSRWGIWHEVRAANDPFFADAGASNRLFQSAFNLKRELRLPSVSGQSMAVASFNNHQKSLVDKFAVRSTAELFVSGCVGWGFERFLYGVYCQLGNDLTRWPNVVRDDLGL
jgi:seryl-tRNA synthetase